MMIERLHKQFLRWQRHRYRVHLQHVCRGLRPIADRRH